MDETSELIKQTIQQTLKELDIKQKDDIRRLKTDPIMATADWLLVEHAIDIRSPYDSHENNINQEYRYVRRYIDRIRCEHCQAYVTVPISKYEYEQTFDDCRIRILRLVLLII
jgi:hypothetical protein